MDGDSVSAWISQLKSGEADAAQNLWDRYAGQLVSLARRNLRDAPKSVVDEDDIAQNVFGSICRGAAAGRFANVKNRDDLWWLLLTVTKQKAVDQIRRELAQKRGMGQVRSESQLGAASDERGQFALDRLIGDDPTPAFIVMLQDETSRLLNLLRDERLRRVALARIEGYTVPEIAVELGISTRAIERKLQLIRAKWGSELSHNG